MSDVFNHLLSSWHSLVESQTSSLSRKIALAAASTAAVVIVLRWATQKRYKLPPGPTALPFLGNILNFRGTAVGDKFNEWKEKYGPLFTFHVGPLRLVVISEIDLMTEAFVKQGSDFSSRPFFYSMDLVSEGSKNIVFAPYGDQWKFQRKIASQALRQYLIGSHLEERVHEVIQSVIKIMLSEKEPFNPHRHLNFAVFNILHGLCFGSVMAFDDPKFLELLGMFDKSQELFGNGFLEDFIPLLRYFPTKRFRALMKMIDYFNGYIHKQVDEHKQKGDKIESLTDNILLAQRQAKEENDPLALSVLTDTHAAQILADVFGAGVDTTRLTLDWLFLILASNPEVQQRMQEEIDNVVGSAIPGKEHRAKLVYTEAVLLETMRTQYVVPVGLPHETIRDTTVGGYEIPAKTTVMINNMAVMKDPTYWDNPLEFRPERFMDESQTKLVFRHKSWIPFSLGHRSCLGESLAKLEMVYVIAGLLQALTFTLAPGEKEDYTPATTGFSHTPKAYKVLVSPRETL